MSDILLHCRVYHGGKFADAVVHQDRLVFDGETFGVTELTAAHTGERGLLATVTVTVGDRTLEFEAWEDEATHLCALLTSLLESGRVG